MNTGAFDPAPELIPKAKAANAWVQVDGAIGLWSNASPSKAHLMAGCADIDSWATDVHKYLNTPYDSGQAFVRPPEVLQVAMAVSAAYLPFYSLRDPFSFTPELSRQARGIEVWAVLHTQGRSGLANLVERTFRFAKGLCAAGYTILNEVVLNQVLVTFGMLRELGASSQAFKRMATAGSDKRPCASASRHGPQPTRTLSAAWKL